jgi:hypothetical protein
MAIPKKILLTCLLALSSAFAQPSATVGTLQGLVTDGQGAPLPGAQVRYRRLYKWVAGNGRQPVPAPGEAVVRAVVSVDANGAFLLTGLPAGDYAFCGSVPALPFLDPCKWAVEPRVTIAAGGTSKYTLVLARGVFLKVRVNDPMHLLPPVKDGPMRAGNLIVGVRFGNGAFLGAENTGVDSAGRDYQMIIPADMPLKLWLFSRHVVLADTNAKAVDTSGAALPLQAVAGNDQAFTFTVSGAAAQSH